MLYSRAACYGSWELRCERWRVGELDFVPGKGGLGRDDIRDVAMVVHIFRQDICSAIGCLMSAIRSRCEIAAGYEMVEEDDQDGTKCNLSCPDSRHYKLRFCNASPGNRSGSFPNGVASNYGKGGR